MFFLVHYGELWLPKLIIDIQENYFVDYGESFPSIEIKGLYYDEIVKNQSSDELEEDPKNYCSAHQFPALRPISHLP